MTEVLELTGSRAMAVALSVGLQFLYHLYYGLAGALTVSCALLVLAIYYLRTRRALPIVAAHGFIDVFGLLQLWR